MKDAMSFRIPVEREDIVVLGSDGLMDNLVSYSFLSRHTRLMNKYDEDILDVLAEFAPPTTTTPARPSPLPTFDPQSVSEALCAKARQISEQTGAVSPFMERAIEEGIDFVGGKRDGMSLFVT
jgi:protein phosphatase PTC7